MRATLNDDFFVPSWHSAYDAAPQRAGVSAASHRFGMPLAPDLGMKPDVFKGLPASLRVKHAFTAMERRGPAKLVLVPS